MTMAPPPGTVRIVGIVVVAGGRALDLALVETDGQHLVRRIETERAVLSAEAIEVAAIEIVRAFLGDRALQPFAVDGLALDAEWGGMTSAGLEDGVGVPVVLAPVAFGDGGFARAERIALGAARIVLDAARASQGLPLSHKP